MKITAHLRRAWLRLDRRAVTALEYGLIAAVMGALVVTAFTTLGSDLDTAFTAIGNVLSPSLIAVSPD